MPKNSCLPFSSSVFWADATAEARIRIAANRWSDIIVIRWFQFYITVRQTVQSPNSLTVTRIAWLSKCWSVVSGGEEMFKLLAAVPAILLALHGFARADEIVPGTEITVRADESINLDKWDRGRIYPATVDRDVYASDGDLIVRRGSPAELIVRQIGPHEMTLDLESIVVNGRRYVVNAPGEAYNTHGRP